MKQIKIRTMLREGCRDNQGIVVGHMLRTNFNFETVNDVKIGKFFDIIVADEVDPDELAKALYNPIIEDYFIESIEQI
jgi:phosphoribosylformylglycinamidine (FGAM) synthase PurS component